MSQCCRCAANSNGVKPVDRKILVSIDCLLLNARSCFSAGTLFSCTAYSTARLTSSATSSPADSSLRSSRKSFCSVAFMISEQRLGASSPSVEGSSKSTTKLQKSILKTPAKEHKVRASRNSLGCARPNERMRAPRRIDQREQPRSVRSLALGARGAEARA